MSRWSIRWMVLASVLLISCFSKSTLALPPRGLILVSPSNSSAGLEIIDGTAYVSLNSGILTIDSMGVDAFTTISHPTLGNSRSITRVVKAIDGKVYSGGNFGSAINPMASALFELTQPSLPLVTWEGSYEILGIDINLQGYGNWVFPAFGEMEPRIFLGDGTTQIPTSPGPLINLVGSSATGYFLANAGVPGTIGSAPAVWNPQGEFEEFVFGAGYGTSIRDRNDTQGINVGGGQGEIKYRDDPPITIRGGPGIFPGDWIIVSHSSFAVVQNLDFPANHPKYAFYPGINPDFPDRAVPLLDIFPELATIDIDAIHDLASVDGFLYMTLSGDDGTFLFGARDPSVVPEPAGVVMISLSITALFIRWRS